MIFLSTFYTWNQHFAYRKYKHKIKRYNCSLTSFLEFGSGSYNLDDVFFFYPVYYIFCFKVKRKLKLKFYKSGMICSVKYFIKIRSGTFCRIKNWCRLNCFVFRRWNWNNLTIMEEQIIFLDKWDSFFIFRIRWIFIWNMNFHEIKKDQSIWFRATFWVL